jgi:hypothetical protein
MHTEYPARMQQRGPLAANQLPVGLLVVVILSASLTTSCREKREFLARLDYLSESQNTMSLSADGHHLAYVESNAPLSPNFFARRLLKTRRRVVTDKFCGKDFDSIGIENVLFDPLSDHVVYRARSGGRWTVVLDSSTWKWYDNVAESSLVFSPDGTRLAYVAGGSSRALVAVRSLAGVYNEMQSYSRVERPTFSPDGNLLAFTAHRDSEAFLVINAVEGERHLAIGPVSFSPDSRRMAYAVLDDSGARLAVDDVRTRRRLVEYPGLDIADKICFGPDGKSLAYRAWVGDRSLFCLDGQTDSLHSNVIDLGFAPGGQHYYCTVIDSARDRVWLVVDGLERAWHYWIDGVIFSCDGKRVAYRAAADTTSMLMVVDSLEGKRYRYVGAPVFSPDGVHLAYCAEDDRGAHLVVDGVERRAHYSAGPVVFDAKDTLHYLATDLSDADGNDILDFFLVRHEVR